MKNNLKKLMPFGFLLTLLLVSFSAFSQVSLQEFDHIDPRNQVPDRMLRQALTYFKINKASFPNQKYIGIIDFSEHSDEKRFHIIDLKSGQVESILVAHGRGSDRNHSGYAQKFSNSANSHATSLGVYRTAEVYYGKHGRSLRLDGLSSTNSNARARAVVIHAAEYVNGGRQIIGRSHGCPAVEPRKLNSVITRLGKGGMIYATR